MRPDLACRDKIECRAKCPRNHAHKNDGHPKNSVIRAKIKRRIGKSEEHIYKSRYAKNNESVKHQIRPLCRLLRYNRHNRPDKRTPQKVETLHIQKPKPIKRDAKKDKRTQTPDKKCRNLSGRDFCA